MSTSKISVDLANRTFDLEVEREDLETVFSMLGELFEKHGGSSVPREQGTKTAAAASNTGEASEAERPPKKRRTSTKGPSKVRTYKTVDLGIGPDERQEIKNFFEAKAPKGQSNEVATLAYALKEKLEKDAFSADEIHSAYRIVNKPTPKNLIAVFGNMKRDGISGYENNELHVNSFTEDHVNFHMTSAGDKD